MKKVSQTWMGFTITNTWTTSGIFRLKKLDWPRTSYSTSLIFCAILFDESNRKKTFHRVVLISCGCDEPLLVMALLPGGRIRSLHLWEKANLLACLFAQFPSRKQRYLSVPSGDKKLKISAIYFVVRSRKCVSCPKFILSLGRDTHKLFPTTMVHHRLASAKRIGDDSSSITSSTSSTMWRRYGCHCGSVRWPTWPPMLLLLLLVSVETLSLATVTTATRMHYIHWNTTNPM